MTGHPDRHLAVVTAGLRRPSSTGALAELLGAATGDALLGRGLVASTSVIEIRDHAQEALDRLLTGTTGPGLREAGEELARADGIVAVTPIFTASYSGLFKLFFDGLDATALHGKPVLLGATAGIERHSLAVDHALRPMFAYLRMLTVPTSVFAVPEDWAAGPSAPGDALLQRIRRAAGELATLVSARTPAHPPTLVDTPH